MYVGVSKGKQGNVAALKTWASIGSMNALRE